VKSDAIDQIGMIVARIFAPIALAVDERNIGEDELSMILGEPTHCGR